MGGNVSVTFLVSLVLPDVVQIVPSNDDGAVHFRRNNQALENSASDADIACEGTLFVDILALDCQSWSFEAHSNLSEISDVLELSAVVHDFLALVAAHDFSLWNWRSEQFVIVGVI